MPSLLFPHLFSLSEQYFYIKMCKTVFTYNPTYFFQNRTLVLHVISSLRNHSFPFKLFFKLFTTGALESLVISKSSYHRATILSQIIVSVMSEESWPTNINFPGEPVINVINLENAWQFVQTIWQQLWSGTVTDGCQKFIKRYGKKKKIHASVQNK